jgi:protein SCO1
MQANRLVAFAVILLVALAVMIQACKSGNKRYLLRGEVLETNVATDEITVKHGDIPGFMAAMTMPYKVKDPGVVQGLEPGDEIAADVVVAPGGGDCWLKNIRISREAPRKPATGPVQVHRLAVGQPVPDLPLTNQDGKTIHFRDFKGKAVLLTFIYTRCPQPNFCPRLSTQFAAIHADLLKSPDALRKTHLLTVTFDPSYDKAPVLRQYGLAYLDNDPAGFAHWDFAFTDPSDLWKLADAFGLKYFEEAGQISHTLDIVLIAPNGTVAKYWATDWTKSELEDSLMQSASAAGSASVQQGAHS